MVWTLQKQKILRRDGKEYTGELYKKDLHETEPSYLLGGMKLETVVMENSFSRFLKPLKTEVPHDLAIPPLGLYATRS